MTSNERKILECVWNHGGEVDIRLISDKTGLSSDYSQYLCRALKSAGHLKLSCHAFCRLSKKGYKYFDENIEEAKKDQEGLSEPVVQQKEDIEKELEELLPNEDEDENKDDENAARETEENVPRNDIKHEEEATEKRIVNPIDNSIGLMIKRFVGLLKGSIKVPESGNVAHGTRHQ